MIELSLLDCLAAEVSLKELCTKDMGASLSFNFADALKKIQEHTSIYHEVFRKKVIELGEEIFEERKMGNDIVKVATGGYKVKEENKKQFQDDMNPLIEQKFQLDINKLSRSATLQALDQYKTPVNGNTLYTLGWLFND